MKLKYYNDMSYVKKIKVNNVEYDIKDAAAVKSVNNQTPDEDGNVNVQGGGGTSDYNRLRNQPQVNGVALQGNKSSSELGLAPASVQDDVNNIRRDVETYIEAQSSFLGFYPAAEDLPETPAQASWAMVGAGLDALTAYVYDTEWRAFSDKVYNIVDFAGLSRRIDALRESLAPLAFASRPAVDNPAYLDVLVAMKSRGLGYLRYGRGTSNLAYVISPMFEIPEGGITIEWSTGMVSTSNWPGIVYYDADKKPLTYNASTVNPRRVTIADADIKYLRLVFGIEHIMESYLYDVDRDKYLFRGATYNLSDLRSKEDFAASEYWGGIGPDENGDWTNWNFTNSENAATAQRNDETCPIYRAVGPDATVEGTYSISRRIDLPIGGSINIEFSCGEVNTGVMIRVLNPVAHTASYYTGNANPRTISVNTATYTQVQLYYKTALKSDCYIKDATHNVMLWQGGQNNE